jgi:glucosamine--fructose-6-phosphate aminotransferase (isomerizing)
MCGIIAYKGQRNAIDVVLKGLKSLEYRGYDSWGIAAKYDHKLSIIKKVGKIGKVSLKSFSVAPSTLAIGHTRWATTGHVYKRNAHPQLSMNKKIAVVHNGIVENYQNLKANLVKKGFKFLSSTDTEVIPNLIQSFMDNGKSFRDAVRSSLKLLEGSFAVVVMHEDIDGFIVARRGSPLVIGTNHDEFFAASDVPAFLEFTSKVIYLDDDEYAVINKEVEVFNIKTNKEVKKQTALIDWNLEQAKKGDYAHFMLKEMCEQKFTVKRAIEQDPALIGNVTNMIKEAFGVFFVGCGTSYHACVSAAYVFAELCKKHVNVILASEFPNYENFLTDKTLMFAVSQSGETADLLEAVKTAKKHCVKVVSVVNVMGSTLTRLADVNIMMNSGPEICVLSTKSYTSQLAILLLLAYSVAGKLREGKKLISKAAGYIPDIIDKNLRTLSRLASLHKNKYDFFLIGRDLAYPSALEGALKIKEVSYIHAEGFAGGELKHGTIALIKDGVPVIVLATKGTRNLILSNAEEIKARGGYIIGINSENNKVYDFFIDVPEVGYANPILMIIPIQILAYYLALARGLDPDKPRNLAKSVTVK